MHACRSDGLDLILDVPIYGRIATMELFRPQVQPTTPSRLLFQGEQQDLLFLTTERYKFCVLSWDNKTKKIITRSNGDLHERSGRPADVGQIASIDPDLRLIVLHLYDGFIKVIPFDGKKFGEAFSIGYKSNANKSE